MVPYDLPDALDRAERADLREWCDFIDLVSWLFGLRSFREPVGVLTVTLGWGDLYA